MRVNVGIRRRLAPLVDNNRRRIELLNSLLFSFPGTPVIYYGDEIGMGDNIYLGDRNGVRTPMQWTSDRNAGFSKCDPARLYFPVVMDPIYGYQAVNAEAQLSEPSSLLRWTHNMIALRKLFQVFGRGTLTFLNPANRRILAYLRDLDRGDGTHETVLCVANLSRFAQPVSLDLSAFAGMKPVEMLGYVPFPAITSDPYALSLAPYSFLWLELHSPDDDADFDQELNTPIEEPAAPAYVLSSGWTGFLAGRGMSLLESSLAAWLPKQRWFGAKTRAIRGVHVRDWTELPPASERYFPPGPHEQSALPFALFYIEVEYTDGASDLYQVCTAISVGAAGEEMIVKNTGHLIAEFDSDLGGAVLCDASGSAEFHQDLLKLIERNATLPLKGREIETWSISSSPPIASPSPALDDASLRSGERAVATPAVPAPLSAQPGEAYEQARTSAPDALSAGAQSIQPRESPAAGNPVPRASRLEARAAAGFQAPSDRLESRAGSAEQSNTSILYADRMILKLFRHLEPGENPDVEVGRFLTEIAHFPNIPSFLGEIFIARADAPKTTVGMLQGFVANQGDGWQWFLAQLQDFFAETLGRPKPPESRRASFNAEREPIAQFSPAARVTLQAAELLGRRTAEMHLALSSSSELSAFTPELFTNAELEREAERIAAQVRSNLEVLKHKLAELDDPLTESAGLLLSLRPSLLARAQAIKNLAGAGERIRIHGDFHLGQTLRTNPSTGQEADAGDFVIIDFEGEPARPLVERRRKQSPLKDVAGMMRSFSYAAFSALERFLAASGQAERNAGAERLEGWARWWQNAASAEFLFAYRNVIAERPTMLPPPDCAQELLDGYLLEKAMYELLYELNNRPEWLRIPIAGILSL
jgi:maltose alpha-D-glucosyltransferase/alpha-amylase